MQETQVKTCKNCTNNFVINAADQGFYQKIDVPTPTWCPTCRHLRRHASINDYNFYTRNCDHCKKVFVSIFPPKSGYIVYCNPCWWSEQRDPFAQAKNYDPSKSFFEQFDELMHTVPQLGIIGMNNENCEYSESVANCKNCYLISESSNCEDCLYGYWLQKSTDCLDCMYTHECEQSYQLLYCFNCYNLKFSQNCFNCSDSYFLDNCIGCKNCLFSTNLRHKEYYIFNKPYSKEAYFEEFKKLQLSSRHSLDSLQEKFQEFLKTQPRKNFQSENIENSNGDYLRNTKNCKDVYHCYDAEECRYGEHIWRGAKYCFDSNTAGRNAELLYETTNSGLDSYNVKFSRYCWGCQNTEYSNECKNGKYLFGCVGLKPGAKYCILNKQYKPEKYEQTIAQIKKNMLQTKEYGEFFPLSIALFGYNNSVSFDEFPFTREEIIQKGWKWEHQISGTKGKGNLMAKDVGDDIAHTPPNILKAILTCESCEKNYKLISQELSFYQKHNVPIPLVCPDCRHRKRLSRKNKKFLYDIKCSQCQQPTSTTLNSQDYPQILCDNCYKKLIY